MKKWLLAAILLALNTSAFAQNSTPLPHFPFPGPALGNADGSILNKLVDKINEVSIGAASPTNTALTTVGAGTLTAAGLIGGLITRSGPVAAFTDTTATGAQLDAALPAGSGLTSFQVQVKNTTAFTETFAGGTGVTLSGRTLATPNSIIEFLVTKTAAATYTMYGIGVYAQTWESSFGLIGTADNGTTQTLTAAMIAGGKITYHVTTGGTTPSLTLPLATAIDTALPDIRAGQSYVLRVINSNSGTATIVTNTGWTTSGTLTIATNTWREFLVTCTTTLSGAYTITSVGTGTNS